MPPPLPLISVCHELRNPLHVVVAAIGFLEEDDSIFGTAAEDISAIASSAAHMQRLVNDVLDLSKLQAGTLKIAAQKVMIIECSIETGGCKCPAGHLQFIRHLCE